MLGMVVSLGLVIGLVHLPLPVSVDRVGWTSAPQGDRIALQMVQSESPPEETSTEEVEDAPPPTDTRTARPEPEPQSVSAAGPEQNRSQENEDTQANDSTQFGKYAVHSIAALGPEDQTPKIVGGMGALYLKIEYPKKAREQGIEGTLELEFTVGSDGTVTDVEVVESLHPLCDSAAVKGVRSVQFVPAKHDGTPIPIRMKLPVRFRLLSAPNVPKTAKKNP